MSAQGSWNIIIDSPMGKQEAVLDLTEDGSTVTGTNTAMGTTTPITNGKISGDKLSFELKITAPMAMNLTFDLEVGAEALSGKVKAGMFGKFNVSGTRA